MFPRLHSDDITEINAGIGFGGLHEAYSCVVHDEINGGYSIELEYPITGELSAEIHIGSIISAAYPSQYSKYFQFFDVTSVQLTIDGVMHVHGEHLSRRLARHVFIPGVYWLTSPQDIIDGMQPNTEPGIKFTGDGGSSQRLVVAAPQSALACLIGENNSFASLGYEIGFSAVAGEFASGGGQWCRVQVLSRLGGDNNASVRFGVNMLDIEHEKDSTGAYNAVVPYWDDGNGNIIYADGYVVQPTTPITPVVAVPLDCSNEFETQPTSAQLVAYARDFLDSKTPWTGSETIKVDFLNGAEVGDGAPDILLGDTVHVYWGDADIATDLRVVAYDYDVLAERYISLELGTPQTQFVAVTGDTASGGGITTDDFVIEQVSAAQVSINAGANSSSSVSCAKTGYTPIALVGFTTNNASIVIVRADIDGTTLYYNMRNVASARANGTFAARVLYVKD